MHSHHLQSLRNQGVFTPDLVKRILKKTRAIKILSFSLAEFKWFAQQSSYPVRSWAALACCTQPRQSISGERKAELKCRLKSYKAYHNLYLAFTGMVHKDVGAAS